MRNTALPSRWPLRGGSFRAQTLADDLETRFPEDTSVRFSYLPTLRALLSLNAGDPSKAIDLLQIAAPRELAMPGIAFNVFFGGFYPAYVRGEAYLQSVRLVGRYDQGEDGLPVPDRWRKSATSNCGLANTRLEDGRLLKCPKSWIATMFGCERAATARASR